MSVKYEDYYKVLGVSRNVSQDELQRAYKRMAKKYHPDISKEPDAEEQFKRVSEAYEVLKNPDTRRQYDALGANWKAGQDFRPPPGWGGGGGAGQNVRFEDLFGGRSGDGMSDFFKMFMGGGFGNAGGAAAGGNPFGGASAGFGGNFNGMGGDPFGGFSPGGASSARGATPRQGASHELDFEVPLEVLYHNGKHELLVRRRGHEDRSYTVRLPPGSTQGSAIRLAGQGDAGVMGGKAGDLLLTVKVLPFGEYAVDGFDLSTPLDLAPWEALSGVKAKLRTPDGEVTVNVPAGLKPGARLRLKQRGLVREDGTRGALYVVPRLVNPPAPTERERELYEELARISSFSPRD